MKLLIEKDYTPDSKRVCGGCPYRYKWDSHCRFFGELPTDGKVPMRYRHPECVAAENAAKALVEKIVAMEALATLGLIHAKGENEQA